MTDVNFSSASVDSIAALLQAITPSSQVKLIDRLSPPSPSKKTAKKLNKTQEMRSATRQAKKRVALEEQWEMMNIEDDGENAGAGEGERYLKRASRLMHPAPPCRTR